MTAGTGEREPGRFAWLDGLRRWLDDNAVQLVLFGIAFGGSFKHWVHLADLNGQPGIESYIAAFCVDLGVYRMTKERARDIRIGRKPRWGVCTLPTLFLVGLIMLTLSGNVATARHTPWGITTALIPGVVLLMAIALGERRAAEDARRVKADKARADRQADTDRRQADRQRRLVELTTPAGLAVTAAVTSASADGVPELPAGTGETGPASGVAVMRAYWDREVPEGRIPTGADLVRVAGLSPSSSLGRQMAAKWRAELGEPRELDGAAR